jgi:hypothetical protein
MMLLWDSIAASKYLSQEKALPVPIYLKIGFTSWIVCCIVEGL